MVLQTGATGSFLLFVVLPGLALAAAFIRAGEAVSEGFGEVFETGANLVAPGSVYYVLRFARRERQLLEDLEREREVREREQRFRLIAERIDEVIFLATGDLSEVL